MAIKLHKHEQLTATLQELARALEPGNLFPSHTEIMRRFSVSDRTALRSLEELKRAGWIVRRAGIGTFVADPALRNRTSAATQIDTVAVLALHSNAFFRTATEHLTTVGSENGLSVVCHFAKHEANFADALPLEALRPRGFVLLSHLLAPVARGLIERGHRTVIIGAPPVGVVPTVPCVCDDAEQGGFLATRSLLDLGHKRIAYAYNYEHHPLQETRRWIGHLRAGGANHSGQIITPQQMAEWRTDSAAATRFFARPNAPTGLVAWNDMDAVLLLRTLRRAGVRVPDDVSLVGYDALPEGADEDPPLCTIDQHLEIQMRNALALIGPLWNSTHVQTSVVIPTLIHRASCAAPRP